MLSREEIIDVLTFAASYDNRTPNEAVVASWLDASDRGRWTFDGAVEAVKEHYARTTAHLMPGHITEAIRLKRAQPTPLPEQRKALESRPAPADPATVRDCMEQVARQLGWDQEIDRRSTLAVTCPQCRAREGAPCTRPARRRGEQTTVPTRRPHPSRVEAAEDHQMSQEASR